MTTEVFTQPADETALRRCKKCGVAKQLTAFHRHSQCGGGRLPVCGDCKYQAQLNSPVFQQRKQAKAVATGERKEANRLALAVARTERMTLAGEKTCKKCGGIKPFDKFPKSVNCRDGRSGTCHACKYQSRKPKLVREKEAQRTKRWRLANPERSRALRRAQNVRHRLRGKGLL